MTEYAAINAEEDFAETFVISVLEPNSVQSGTLAKQKMDLLSSFPAVLVLEQHIRTNVASYLAAT